MSRALCGAGGSESDPQEVQSLRSQWSWVAANRGPEVLCDHPGQLLVSSADAIDRPAAHPNLPLAPLPARAVDLSKQAPRDGGLEAGAVSRLVLLQIGIRRKG
jgi:hypothetical protein